MHKMNIVKSINVNTIFDKKTTKQHLGKPLCRIAGEVDDFIVANSKFGDSIGFKGVFTAVNLLTGEVFESTAAFIPAQLTATLKEKLSSGNAVFIEFDLMALESSKSPTGYTWIAEKPMTEERKRLADAMREKALELSKTLALPAPSKKGGK